MKELSVIIPAYNEDGIIYRSLKEVERILDDLFGSHNLDYEIIVVDDGSRDKTYAEAMRASEENGRIKVVRKENGGKGTALKYGFNFCSGKFVTFLDADLDFHPRQIPLFFQHIEKFNADVVVGSKRHPLSKINYPFHRRVLSQCYQVVTKILFGLNLRDTQAGLKLFRHEVLEDVLPKVLCEKYAFDLELLVNAKHKGFKIVEAPVELNWQRVSSRIRLKDIWEIVLDTATIFYRLRISRHYDGLRR